MDTQIVMLVGRFVYISSVHVLTI